MIINKEVTEIFIGMAKAILSGVEYRRYYYLANKKNPSPKEQEELEILTDKMFFDEPTNTKP